LKQTVAMLQCKLFMSLLLVYCFFWLNCVGHKCWDVCLWYEMYGVQNMSRSTFPCVANNSLLLKPWRVGPGAKPWRWHCLLVRPKGY